MVGLHSSTNSTSVVIGGILLIAIADAFSDALGIHISEESENKHSTLEIWEATLVTLASKCFFALSFIIPILLFDLSTAIIVSIVWGLLLIMLFSYYTAKKEHVQPYKSVLEHLVIASFVIVVTHYIGDWIATISIG